MKTDDLKALGLNDDQVQRVFAMNGEELNSLKASVATLTAERDTARTNLADANKKLEGYDPDWKQKATDAEQKAAAQRKAEEKAAAIAAWKEDKAKRDAEKLAKKDPKAAKKAAKEKKPAKAKTEVAAPEAETAPKKKASKKAKAEDAE